MTNQLILLEPDLFDAGAATRTDDRRPTRPDTHPTPTARRARGRAAASVDDANEYHLDEHTREVGKAGLAAARQALAEAVRRAEARSAAEPVAA
jgi:hypothetical protein